MHRCGHARRVTSPSHTPIGLVDRDACDLLLRVSNNSPIDDPVRLSIRVDATDVIDQEFEYRREHYSEEFALMVGPGAHRLRISSDTGVVGWYLFKMPHTDVRRYATITYFNYEDEDGKLIDWYFSSRPIGVM